MIDRMRRGPTYDGAGMGGWAAVRAARARGARVALFERGLVGGT